MIMNRIFLLLLTVSTSLFSQELEFNHANKKVYSVTKNDKRLNKIKVELWNAWRGYKKEYVGYEFTRALTVIYGEKWKKSSQIVFVCTDGYQPSIDTQKMLKMIKEKNFMGVIAVNEADKKGFTTFKRGDKTIDPGPFYLVWTKFTKDQKATYGDVLKWPYQLKTIFLTFDKINQ